MTSLQSRHTGFWLHLAAWSVVFGLPLFVPGGREPVMNMQEYVRFLVVPLSFMAVFYVNYLLLIDRYLFTRHVTLRCELDVPPLNVKREKAPGDGAKPAESKE